MLENQTKNKLDEPVYFFTGEDLFTKNEAIDKIVKSLNANEFNYSKHSCDDVNFSEIINLANTPPTFSDVRILVLRRIEKLKEKQKKALLEYVQDPINSTCLILTCDDKKKARNFASFKKYSASKDFPLLRPNELASWISGMFQKQNLKAGFGECKMLAEFVGSDLQALASEIEKLSLYIDDRPNKIITQDDILACVGFTKEENPFRLNNAILYSRKVDALEAIDNLIKGGETAFAILSQTYYALRVLYKIVLMKKSGLYNEQEIYDASGLRFDNQKSIIRGSLPKESALERAFKKIIDIELTLKTQTIDRPEIMLKSVILTAFSNR